MAYSTVRQPIGGVMLRQVMCLCAVWAATASAAAEVTGARPLELAILDMAETWPDRFPDAEKLLAELKSLPEGPELAAFERKALLRNPLLDFDKLLVVRRSAKDRKILPANWQSNSSIPIGGHSNDLVVLSIKDPDTLESLYRPPRGAFIGDVDLHFDADKALFSSRGTNGAWQVMEIDLATKTVRQVTQTQDKQINNYDACYLPDARILFTSTAPYVAVPCVNGSAPVANAFRCRADGSEMEQLTFDQEHAWCPQVMADGRILYLRWEYADLPHANSRIMMTMNPDGCNQRAYYGSSSFWPNGIFYARQIPGRTSMFIGIVTGHHGVKRQGELILFDTARGYEEADGVVQRIPGYGKTVQPVVSDRLVDRSRPHFLHPYPLSDKYFLVSCNAGGGWNIYLADVFDNLTLINCKTPDTAFYEPVPFQKTPLPRAVADKVIRGRKDATVFISDIYEGPGLAGIPRGEVKRLRLFTYTYGYRGMGGLYGVLGVDGPWDIRRILGTVPVEPDGSSIFNIPANTPISIQPLDSEGKALQLMRSWFVGRPGENLSCIGCHEPPGTAPTVLQVKASRKAPAEIEPWRGPVRNFEFKHEVQPVIDQYCLSCHATTKPEEGKLTIAHEGRELPYLGGDVMLKGWNSKHAGRGAAGGRYTVAYFNLCRYTRHSGEESEMKVLTPMEFHADTCELVMMLDRGHHGVKLDEEAMDRIVTWIDLNTPYHGRWSEIVGQQAITAEARRSEMRKRYAGVDENHEAVPRRPAARKPVPPSPETDSASSAVELEVHERPKDVPTTTTLSLADVVQIDLVHIPAGSLSGKKIPAFWMARCEVSNKQFAQFDDKHDSRHEDRHGYQFGVTAYPVNAPDQPAVRLSWKQANAFCAWLSQKVGKKVRLPTEWEWEWACRAGTTTAMNYGNVTNDFSKHGNMADFTLHYFSANPYQQDVNKAPYGNHANIFDNRLPQIASVRDDGFLSVPGGKYEPNAWGLCDMHGNVAEWTASLYDPNVPGERVVRGGSWYDRPKLCTSAFRRPYRDYQKVFNVGFRVVVDD